MILGVFGSYAREEQKETSDMDILVKVERPLGLKFITAKIKLERLLGLKVDLVSINAVKQKPLLWKSISIYRRRFDLCLRREKIGGFIF